MRRGRRGFTLLEILLVLALLVVLGALAFPSVEAMYGGIRLRAGADALGAALTNARAHAMDEGRNYRVAVLVGQGNFRVAPEGGGYWGNGTPSRVIRAGSLATCSPRPFVRRTGRSGMVITETPIVSTAVHSGRTSIRVTGPSATFMSSW